VVLQPLTVEDLSWTLFPCHTSAIKTFRLLQAWQPEKSINATSKETTLTAFYILIWDNEEARQYFYRESVHRFFRQYCWLELLEATN
jgi:hypothetical protein